MRKGSGRSGRKIDYRKNQKGHKLLERLAYKYSLARKNKSNLSHPPNPSQPSTG